MKYKIIKLRTLGGKGFGYRVYPKNTILRIITPNEDFPTLEDALSYIEFLSNKKNNYSIVKFCRRIRKEVVDNFF